MNAASPHPLHDTLRWLNTHAGFPASRLETRAEKLLCISALAAAHEAPVRQRFELQRRVPDQTSSQRAHALRRAHTHMVADNRTAV